MTEKYLLKDVLFNLEKLKKIASEIESVFPKFDSDAFIEDNLVQFPTLELKERISFISQSLKRHLPSSYEQAVTILIKSLPKPCNPALSDNDFGDFIYASYGEFVVQNGCNPLYLELSLSALLEITQRFSMEYAIRTFINAFPQETYECLKKWTEHKHYHVRRLCSEGTRPKLPWGKKITTPVSWAVPLLDSLYVDSTRFVTRSVANHLNDLSKIDPELVIQLLKKWHIEQKQTAKELDFITRHALRTLFKNGNVNVMEFMDLRPLPELTIQINSISKEVELDAFFEFSIDVHIPKNCKILIDYVLHFQNSKNELKSKKVFKIKQLNTNANEKIQLRKRHWMKKDSTTRKLYSGTHRFELQINGTIHYTHEFQLIGKDQ